MRLPTWNEIADAARERGLSIAGLCRRADIDPTSFYRWKNGRTPSGRIIQKMLNVIEAVTPISRGESHE